MTIEEQIKEAKQKVAEKYYYNSWEKYLIYLIEFFPKSIEQFTDEAWQMVLESEKENFKKILESTLRQKDNVAKGLCNFIKQLKAENERLRNDQSSSQVLIPFNLNHNIKVKLKDAGIEHYVRKYNSVMPFHLHISFNEYKSKANNEGYHNFQLWNFLDDFGALGRLLEDLVHLDILITKIT